MKKWLTLFTLLLCFGFAAPHAEAKKMGGGSFGKSYKTAPVQPTAAPLTGSKSTTTAAPTKKSGFMGGMLGGLLAGGMFAWLLGSGAFSGFSFFDFLILGGVAFVIMRMFRAKRAAASGGSYQQPHYSAPNSAPMGTPTPAAFTSMSSATSGSTGFNSSDVPFQLPPGFDMNAFLAGARDHYRTLQEAWNSGDLQKMREYMSPELYEQLAAQRAQLSGSQHTEVMYVDAQLVRADYQGQWAQVSVLFTGRYQDRHESLEAAIDEVWHLERDLNQNNAPWYIVGIEDRS